MTKSLLTLLSALTLAVSPLVARSLDALSRTRLMSSRSAIHKMPRINAAADSVTDSIYVPAVLEVSGPEAVDSLRQLGSIIMRRRDNFVICCVPQSRATGLDSVRYILSGNISSACSINTDVLRDFTNVGAVHTYNTGNATGGYDGTGVVVGFCDIGFDPGHVAFKNRVPLMVDYTMRRGERRIYRGELPLTDRADEFHGTHVANIMAGSRENNPFYGVAPGATIIATTSDLYDASLLCGIEDVIDYAREHNMPAVVNLSMGNQLGPRDGSDVVNRYLDLLGQEAIICFSAGNSGSYEVSLRHDFSTDNETVGTLYESKHTYDGMHISGMTDVWSADNREVEIQIVVYDFDTRAFVYESPWYGGNFDIDLSVGDNAIPTAFFPTNNMYLSGGISPDNGRYNIALSYDMVNVGYRRGNPWGRYYFGFRLRGQAGVSVDINTDGESSLMRSQGLPGFVTGDGTVSISNYACGHHVISVGSYNSRNVIPLAGGGEKVYNFDVGTATGWSGHGTLRDGRVLPDICAPGNYVVSATSRAFYDLYPDRYPVAREWTAPDGTIYHWHGECGTSMSSPAAAGTFALWLQANPHLTRDEIVEIARLTSIHDVPDAGNPRWGGAGRLDAKAGLDMVIRRLGVNSPSINYRPEVSVVNGVIMVTVPGVDAPRVTVCDMSGRTMPTGISLPTGLYLVNVSTPSSVTTLKVHVP